MLIKLLLLAGAVLLAVLLFARYLLCATADLQPPSAAHRPST
jgi:hypothetical protein